MEMYPPLGQSCAQICWPSISKRCWLYASLSKDIVRAFPGMCQLTYTCPHNPLPLLHWHLIRSSFSPGLAVHQLCTWFSNRLGHYHMLLMDVWVRTLPATPVVAMINEQGCLIGLCALLLLLYFSAVLDDWKENVMPGLQFSCWNK